MHRLTVVFVAWTFGVMSIDGGLNVLPEAFGMQGVDCFKCSEIAHRCDGDECIPDEENGTALRAEGQGILVYECVGTKLGHSSCLPHNLAICYRWFDCNDVDCLDCQESSPEELEGQCTESGVECSCPAY